MQYFIAVIGAAFLGSSAAVRTEPERACVCFSTAETREKILAHRLSELFRAMRSAANRSQAEAIGVKLCRWNEQLVYEMSLLRPDGRIILVYVNVKTGQSAGALARTLVAPFFRVTIDDEVPELEASLRQAVLSRGKRLDETKPGSGLGLSIVAELASLYGGHLSLEDCPAGGLRAELLLPSA